MLQDTSSSTCQLWLRALGDFPVMMPRRMLGFVTAMETFCGQAFGARRFSMVGVVLQRGLSISTLYCCCALLMWNWSESMLVYMGQV